MQKFFSVPNVLQLAGFPVYEKAKKRNQFEHLDFNSTITIVKNVCARVSDGIRTDG